MNTLTYHSFNIFYLLLGGGFKGGALIWKDLEMNGVRVHGVKFTMNQYKNWGGTPEIAHCYLCFLLKLDVCMLLKFLFSEIGFELSVAENEVILLIPLSAKNSTYIDP